MLETWGSRLDSSTGRKKRAYLRNNLAAWKVLSPGKPDTIPRMLLNDSAFPFVVTSEQRFDCQVGAAATWASVRLPTIATSQDRKHVVGDHNHHCRTAKNQKWVHGRQSQLEPPTYAEIARTIIWGAPQSLDARHVSAGGIEAVRAVPAIFGAAGGTSVVPSELAI
jgi:hypothetical protein